MFRHFDANPVWVKDLRQAARNPLVTGLLNLLLVGFMLACVAIVLSREGYMEDSYAGQPVFGIIGGVTAGASFLFIPIYFFVRTMMEGMTINSDLLYITNLTPRQIIRGKFLSAAYLILLFYSTAFPFLVFSYILRGVDLPTILLSTVFAYTINLLMTLIAITWALLPWGITAKIISGILGNFLLLMFFSTFTGLRFGGAFFLMGMGIDGTPWLAYGLYLFNYLLLLGMLYYWTVALVTTPSANKSLPVRKYFTVWAVLVLVQCFGFSWYESEEEIAYVGVFILCCSIFAGYFFCIGFRDMPITDRIRREIPQGGVRYWASCLLSNGKYTGLLWLTLLWLLTLGAFFAFHTLWELFQTRGFRDRDLLNIYLGSSNIILYGFGYALLANGIERMISPHRHHRLAPLFFLLLLFLPPLFLSIVTLGDMPEHIPFVLFTVFMEEDFLFVHLVWSTILIIGCHAGNREWIWNHFSRFYGLPKEADSLESPNNE